MDRVTSWLLPEDRTVTSVPVRALTTTTAAVFAPATAVLHSAQSARLRQLFADGSARADGDSHSHSHSHSQSHGVGATGGRGSGPSAPHPAPPPGAEAGPGSRVGSLGAGVSPAPAPFGAGGWSSRGPALSPFSPVPDGPGPGPGPGGLGTGTGLGWTAEDAKEFADRYPFPLAALSSRVIVAADAAGYIRVLVRSGGVLRDIR